MDFMPEQQEEFTFNLAADSGPVSVASLSSVLSLQESENMLLVREALDTYSKDFLCNLDDVCLVANQFDPDLVEVHLDSIGGVSYILIVDPKVVRWRERLLRSVREIRFVRAG